MKGRILILGAGVMQGPAIMLAEKLGLRSVVLDGNPNAPCASLASEFYPIDLKDKEAILQLAKRLQSEEASLVGIMTAGTDFSSSVAFTAESLGLPGISYESALKASDKEMMRACFKENSVPSPDFMSLNASLCRKLCEEIRGMLKTGASAGSSGKLLPFALPAVVKPVDNMGARGCRLARNLAELALAVEDALRYSRGGRVIIEEFIEGEEYSIDSIVHNGRITITGFALRHIFFPPFFIEMGHTISGATNWISPKKRNEIFRTFKRGVRALGIDKGAAKGDVKFGRLSRRPGGGDVARAPRAYIGEIAARLSGGYMSGWTYPYASGAEPTRAAIRIACRKRPENLRAKKNWTSAERAFISIPGKIKEIRGAEAARKIKFIKNIFFNRAPGDTVKFPENNVEKCGNVISAAPRRKQAISAARNAIKSIYIILDTPNNETSAFLSEPLGLEFPPSAYQLPPELLKEIEAIPKTSDAGKARSNIAGAVKPVESAKPAVSTKSAGNNIFVFPFDSFLKSNFKDYAGRLPAETLDAIRRLSGLALPLLNAAASQPEGAPPNGVLILGREFWSALIRGGYQGGMYYIKIESSTRNPASVGELL